MIHLNIDNKDDNIIENNQDIKRNSFYKNNFNENGSTVNFYKANQSKDESKRIENGNNLFEPLYNLEIKANSNINKKREKSFENRKQKKFDK